MDGSGKNGSGCGRFDLLVKWLGQKNPRKHAAAVTLLCRLGQLAAPLLVHEAIKPGKRSLHRIAILDVVEKIGGPLGPDEMFSLQDLLGHRDGSVRQKAEEVIMSLSRGGFPQCPAGAALMRAFNPFLVAPPRRRRRPSMLRRYKAYCQRRAKKRRQEEQSPAAD